MHTTRPNPTGNGATVIDLVVHELSVGHTRNEVCRILCEHHGYTWDTAHTLVQQVATLQRKQIAWRAAPLQLVLGSLALVGGIAMILGSIYLLLNHHYLTTYRPFRLIASGITFGGFLALGGIGGLWFTFRSLWQ